MRGNLTERGNSEPTVSTNLSSSYHEALILNSTCSQQRVPVSCLASGQTKSGRVGKHIGFLWVTQVCGQFRETHIVALEREDSENQMNSFDNDFNQANFQRRKHHSHQGLATSYFITRGFRVLGCSVDCIPTFLVEFYWATMFGSDRKWLYLE